MQLLLKYIRRETYTYRYKIWIFYHVLYMTSVKTKSSPFLYVCFSLECCKDMYNGFLIVFFVTLINLFH